MNPLAIVPTYVRQDQDILLLEDCLETMRNTADSDVLDVLVVDDGSPEEELVGRIDELCGRYDAEFEPREINSGFARTVNVGLLRARKEGRDAILVNADIAFDMPGWLEAMQETDAGIVGALLLYPNGTIQHAGIYFSMLSRTFDHIYHYGPGNLPEAQVPRECPVTAALQYIRHGTMEEVGLYDEEFRLGFEDVDYCIRAWQRGITCCYQPRAIATHHESYFRSRPTPKIMRWQQGSWLHFAQKHAQTNFAQFVPSLALGAT